MRCKWVCEFFVIAKPLFPWLSFTFGLKHPCSGLIPANVTTQCWNLEEGNGSSPVTFDSVEFPWKRYVPRPPMMDPADGFLLQCQLYYKYLVESKPTGWRWVQFMMSWLTGLDGQWARILFEKDSVFCACLPSLWSTFQKLRILLPRALNGNAVTMSIPMPEPCSGLTSKGGLC